MHRCSLPRKGQWAAVGDISCPITCSIWWGAICIFTQIWVLRDRRGQAADRQGGASPIPPATQFSGWQNAPEAQTPWTADGIPPPSSGEWHLGAISKAGQAAGVLSDTCPQKPSPERGAGRLSPCCWSCRCHAAVCDPDSQTNPPTPLLRYHTSGPLQTKHSFSNLYDSQCQTPL